VTDPWDAVAALADRSRRALYEYVCAAGHPVSREEAADVADMSRGLAAFHLDKLVEAGLLRADYASPTDVPRGRGRTPKVYEPQGQGVAVTLPERRYQLLAEIFADAIADDPARADALALGHARRRGLDIGAQLRTNGDDITSALANLGFAPERDRDRLILRNCPFHALALRHTAMVCGLNEAFLTGLVDGIGASGVRACLAPHAGRCCVQLSYVD
jgi:predicted ArsR family transcriptional regulator